MSEWTFDLEGYEPKEWDWVLVRRYWDDVVVRVNLTPCRSAARDGDRVRMKAVHPHTEEWAEVGDVIAYWRPPAPPEVPDGD